MLAVPAPLLTKFQFLIGKLRAAARNGESAARTEFQFLIGKLRAMLTVCSR